jgi:hypothetical protein
MRQPEQSNIVRTGDASENLELHTSIEAKFRKSEFLPEQDPLPPSHRILNLPYWMRSAGTYLACCTIAASGSMRARSRFRYGRRVALSMRTCHNSGSIMSA